MSLHLVLHGLAVKKHADAKAVADFAGIDVPTARKLLAQAVASGRAVEMQGKLMLTPLARAAIDGTYSREYVAMRNNAAFVGAYKAFESINAHLKALITDWQTVSIGGARVPNDHSNRDYDMEVIDRLGDLHERTDKILGQMAKELPRFEYYRRQLSAALERAEEGQVEWVSDARIASYHTVWFELHEDLLRILGHQRTE